MYLVLGDISPIPSNPVAANKQMGKKMGSVFMRSDDQNIKANSHECIPLRFGLRPFLLVCVPSNAIYSSARVCKRCSYSSTKKSYLCAIT